MATSNRMLPIMTGVVVVIFSGILVQRCTSDEPLKADEPMQTLPRVTSADADTTTEALATVTTSNNKLREDVQQLIEQNRLIMEENSRLRSGSLSGNLSGSSAAQGTGYDAVVDLGSSDSAAPASAPAIPPANPPTSTSPSPLSSFSKAFDDATNTLGQISSKGKEMVTPDTQSLREAARGSPLPPQQSLGAATETQRGKAPVVRYVRTSAAVADQQALSAEQAVAMAQTPATPPADVPYFTLPDNATLVDVTAMTAIIGRVPIDGRVTDPMQFKAIVGKHNLAANGWELPSDIEGMIVSGIAVGDMALSCSEGHIQSITFIFQDGTVQTVASRGSANSGSSTGSRNSSSYLGYVSDLHGNPCIVGRFVTNAPSYLTDVVGLKALEVAAQSFASAQTSTNQTSDGFSSAVTGSRGDYVLGQAASSAASEVSQWLLARMKNSFDAVVTPAGQRLVVHLTQEVKLDKTVNARKIVHRQQAAAINQRGGHYGLE